MSFLTWLTIVFVVFILLIWLSGVFVTTMIVVGYYLSPFIVLGLIAYGLMVSFDFKNKRRKS